VHFHKLRWSFASEQEQKGAPNYVTQEQLGTGDIQTTKVYAYLK